MLWRWRQRRLEAEVVRDSILAVSGRLNPRMGGPGVYPTLPARCSRANRGPARAGASRTSANNARRSIYIFAKRSLAVPELELLDTPDTTSSCERRIVSTTGPQALTFLNGAFIHEQARHFAVAAHRRGRAASPRTRCERAFALALGRPPRPEESRAALEFLDKQERQIEADAAAAKPSTERRRRPAQGPRGVLPGRFEHERVRLQQLTDAARTC